MEHQGYIKLYRKLLENPISYNVELLGFLSFLLLEVNHTEQEIYRGNIKIKLKPGERIVSQRMLAQRFSISISKVHRFIKILEQEGILEHEGNTSFTIVKLLNWDTYNGSETRKEHKKNTKRTQEEIKQEGIQGEEGKEGKTGTGNSVLLNEKIQTLDEGSVRYDFYSYLLTLGNNLEQELSQDSITSIDLKLEKYYKEMGKQFISEMESFIIWHTENKSKFSNVLLRLNSWFNKKITK